MYTIKLSDGTELKNLELNGNNYIAPKVLEDSVFEGKLGAVTISDGETTEEHTDMVLIQNKEYDGKSWFILGEKSAQENELESLQVDLEVTKTNLTDVQIALAEIYELIAGGK